MMGVSDQNMTYLDGTLPGDFGFDPLGMSDPEGAGGFVNPQWLAYSEVIHGRWAMLGVAGIVAPEILGGMGIIPESTGLVWFTSGAIPPQGTFDYWAQPDDHLLGQHVPDELRGDQARPGLLVPGLPGGDPAPRMGEGFRRLW